MPSTVSQLFAAAGAEHGGVVRWGERIAETKGGVYAVSTTDTIDSAAWSTSAAPISRDALEQLLVVRPELRVDGARPTVDDVRDRLGQFWLSDELVLYIGRATSLRRRVDQYYATQLGAAKPHAGGWWLKTLGALDDLWVHWAATPDYRLAEKRMLQAFAGGVSRTTARELRDAERLMPFANLVGHNNRIKRHEISGARGTVAGHSEGSSLNAAQRMSGPLVAASLSSGSAPARPAAAASGRWPTQRVTAKDFEAGRIRLPARSKGAFPRDRGDVTVALRGRDMRARWDPRIGPPERSGVLAFGRGKLEGIVLVDEVLDVVAGVGGKPELE